MEIVIKLAIVLAVVGIGWFIKTRDMQRVEQMDAEGACLSCFSTDVEIEGDRAKCRACGFEFGADRGGALTARDMDAVSRQTPRDAF